MASLNLWINSVAYQMTAEGCTTLIQAIDKAEEGGAVSYRLRKQPPKPRNYLRGFLKIDGVRVNKKLWPRLRAACRQVIDGTDATFQVGFRVISARATSTSALRHDE